MWAEEEQRERETQNLKQALSCWHRAQRGACTHKLWDHDLSWSPSLNQLSHPGAPQIFLFLNDLKKIFLMFIFERERDRMWVWEVQWERETQNLKHTPGSELSAQSLMQGSNPRTARSWPELKSDAQPTEPPRCPWQLKTLYDHNNKEMKQDKIWT